MRVDLGRKILTALHEFSSDSRLYALSVADDRGELRCADLLVEAFASEDRVGDVGVRDVIVLATDPRLDPDALLGRRASFEVSLANGSRMAFFR
jgi:type VI secretion system secreted protein VgrG